MEQCGSGQVSPGIGDNQAEGVSQDGIVIVHTCQAMATILKSQMFLHLSFKLVSSTSDHSHLVTSCSHFILGSHITVVFPQNFVFHWVAMLVMDNMRCSQHPPSCSLVLQATKMENENV